MAAAVAVGGGGTKGGGASATVGLRRERSRRGRRARQRGVGRERVRALFPLPADDGQRCRSPADVRRRAPARRPVPCPAGWPRPAAADRRGCRSPRAPRRPASPRRPARRCSPWHARAAARAWSCSSRSTGGRASPAPPSGSAPPRRNPRARARTSPRWAAVRAVRAVRYACSSRGNARSGLFWARSCRPWRMSASASVARSWRRLPAARRRAPAPPPTVFPRLLRTCGSRSSPVNRAAAPAVLVPRRNLAAGDARPWMYSDPLRLVVVSRARLLRRGRLHPRARRGALGVGVRQTARLRRALGRVLRRHGLAAGGSDAGGATSGRGRLGGRGGATGGGRHGRRDRRGLRRGTTADGPPAACATAVGAAGAVRCCRRVVAIETWTLVADAGVGRASPGREHHHHARRAIATPPTRRVHLLARTAAKATRSARARPSQGAARRHRRPAPPAARSPQAAGSESSSDTSARSGVLGRQGPHERAPRGRLHLDRGRRGTPLPGRARLRARSTPRGRRSSPRPWRPTSVASTANGTGHARGRSPRRIAATARGSWPAARRPRARREAPAAGRGGAAAHPRRWPAARRRGCRRRRGAGLSGTRRRSRRARTGRSPAPPSRCSRPARGRGSRGSRRGATPVDRALGTPRRSEGRKSIPLAIEIPKSRTFGLHRVGPPRGRCSEA